MTIRKRLERLDQLLRVETPFTHMTDAVLLDEVRGMVAEVRTGKPVRPFHHPGCGCLLCRGVRQFFGRLFADRTDAQLEAEIAETRQRLREDDHQRRRRIVEPGSA